MKYEFQKSNLLLIFEHILIKLFSLFSYKNKILFSKNKYKYLKGQRVFLSIINYF